MSEIPTIGASELAITVGLQRRHADGTPWTSGFELWARLRGLLPRYDSESSPDADAGKTMEPGIGLAYAEEHGLAWGTDMLPGPPFPSPGLWHADIPWLAARPDFLAPARERVVQAKAPRELHDDEWGPSGTGEVPVWVAVQEAAELAVVVRVLSWEVADVAVHARAGRRGDRTRAEFTLRRDERFERRLLARAAEWYRRHVEDGEPPPPDGSPSTSKALSRVFRPTDTVLEATPDDVKRWHHILQLRTHRDDLEARVREEEQRICARMKEATKLVHEGRTLATWRAKAGASRVDVTRLRRERPDIAAAYTKVGEPGRSFHIETNQEDE